MLEVSEVALETIQTSVDYLAMGARFFTDSLDWHQL